MPQKKPKKTRRHAVSLRFSEAEAAPLKADRDKIASSGIPASLGAYAKHAVLSYPRLRNSEAMTKSLLAQISNGSVNSISTIARCLDSILAGSS